MLSIIIPTKNEEECLQKLLDSIKMQNLKDIEIIIADADSTDKTREIAKKYYCKIVKGGMPAKGRNEGAKQSNGENFVFIDSDVILPDGFLKAALKEFNERNLDIAGTLQFPISTGNRLKDLEYRIIYTIGNRWMKRMENTKKPYMQMCMFVKKEIHKKIGGFNEKIIYAEDSEYAKRASKNGKFGILRAGKIMNSPRRFEREGLKFFLKLTYFNIGRFFGHEFTENSRTKYF